jgi:exopolysaccharide biosynthesis polyprenyl glycosylphosphotransferase
MLSRQSESSRISLFVLDQVLLAAAFAAAVFLRRDLVASGELPGVQACARMYLVAAPLVAIALWACGLYRAGQEPVWPRLTATLEPLWGGLAAMTMVGLTRVLLDPAHDMRPIRYLFLGTGIVALLLSRMLVSRGGRDLAGTGDGVERLLVFGMSRRMLRLLAELQRGPRTSLCLVGVAADAVPSDLAPRLTLAEALALLEQGSVDQVLIEADTLGHELLQRVLATADREGISVHITSPIFPATNLVPTWQRVGGVPLLGFVAAELPLGARAVKRCFDMAVAAALLALLTAPMLVLALAVRLTSRGPALFVQERVGAHGRAFRMLKFRTMAADAERSTGPVMAVADDPRCTRLGSLLRRTNLDELPQLVNVLLGHMSLVGPRPERPEFVREFKERIPRYAHKHWVKPGITGWAQIHGLRGASTSLPDRIDHDLYYIEHWSLALDIRILVRTVFYGYLNAA